MQWWQEILEDILHLYEKIVKVVDPRPGEIMFGLNLVVNRGKTIFVCDTSVIEYPDANQLADMAISASRVVRLFGFDPKVAFLSHSTFGQPVTDRTKRISDAVKILKKRKLILKLLTYLLQKNKKDPKKEVIGNEKPETNLENTIRNIWNKAANETTERGDSVLLPTRNESKIPPIEKR